MKQKNLLSRGLEFLLALAIVSGLVFCVANAISNVHTVYGSASVKTIAGLGTNIIADPIVPADEDAAWTGSYVYFGTYNGSPVKYRVLDSNTTVYGGTTMLLDCDSILWAGSSASSVFDAESNPDSNVWAESDIRAYLNETFLTGNFTTLENNAIASSIKVNVDSTDGAGCSELKYAPLNGDKVFLLDAREATNTSYGYSDTDDAVVNRVKTGGNTYWWLRSANTDFSFRAGSVYPIGNIYNRYVYDLSVGVSPALNVNLSNVLFSSAITGTAGATGAEYKLTLLDNDMKISVNGTVTRKGDVITIPYTIHGANSANISQISVLILDKEYTAGNINNANVITYGALDVNTGEFTIPSDISDKICGSDYHAYIVAEDVNSEKETDYASTPLKISFEEETTENTETEEATTGIEETTSGIEETTKHNDKEEPTTIIEETTENTEAEETTSIIEETTTYINTKETSAEYEEEATTLILEDNSSDDETTSIIADNTDNKGDSGKNGNGWIIWVVLSIVILFVVILIFLFIFKKKKSNEEQEVTEENKDI